MDYVYNNTTLTDQIRKRARVVDNGWTKLANLTLLTKSTSFSNIDFD